MASYKPWWLAARTLLRRPAFSLTAAAVLALGIGATATLFAVVNTVLLQPLPYPDSGRLALVMGASPSGAQRTSLLSPAAVQDWNRMNQSFVPGYGIAGLYSETETDTSGSEPERLAGMRVSPGYFRVMGMQPLRGRWFSDEEQKSVNGPSVAILSYNFWTSRYGRSGDVLEHHLVLGGVRYDIVGVMPRDFTSSKTDVWVPARTPDFLMRMREARFYSGVGRLRPGVTLAEAQADLNRVEGQIAQQYPATEKGYGAEVSSLKDFQVGSSSAALWSAFAAVVLLLLLAIANIAGLTLAQLQSRERELAIRSALGGSRGQVVATVMREMVLLATAGAAAGGVLAWAGVRAAAHLAPGTLPRMAELHFSWLGWLFAVGVSALAALGFGLAPAWAATRPRLAQMLASLNAGAPGGKRRLQRGLVVGQLALTVLLLSSAGLLLRSYYNLSHVRGGFDTNNVFTFHVSASWNEARGPLAAMQQHLIDQLQSAPGVVAAGFTNFLPASDATLRYQVQFQGLNGPGANGTYSLGVRQVTPGYLNALHVPIVAGSNCPAAMPGLNTTSAKALVNLSFVDTYLHGEPIVGRGYRLPQDDPKTPFADIIGVVGNVREDNFAIPASPYIYVCMGAGWWPDPEYVVRTAGDPAAMMAGLRAIVDQAAPGRAVFGLDRLATVLDAGLEQPRLNARLLAMFAGFALLLAAVGLYSLISLVVAGRRRELGVRIALGARPAQAAGLVLASTGRLLAGGAAIGLALTWAGDRLLQSQLYGVGPLDPLTIAATLALLALIAGAAAWLPARRAAGTDAVAALK